jgi:hemolysin D
MESNRPSGATNPATGPGFQAKSDAGSAAPPGQTGRPMTIQADAIDREFLPAALELLETPPSPIRVAAIWFICALFTTAFAWSYFGRLDIYAVAQGRIHPTGRSKVVQPLEAGKIVLIAVENGRQVAAGEVLLELDPTETGAEREALARDLESAQAEIARRQVAVAMARKNDFIPPPIAFETAVGDITRNREQSVLAADLSQLAAARASLTAQLAERSAARDRLSASIAAREQLLELGKERVDMRETLVNRGALSRAMVIESLQQYITLVTTQVGERGQLAETTASLTTIARKLDEVTTQFISDQSQKLVEAQRKTDRLAQELIKARSKNERLRLAAPISGTVQQLSVTTVGQVVTTGQSLMTIVPTDAPIEIEVLVQNQDIGFVEPGQPAVVKIEAFPFTRYGTIDGTVAKVSRDSVDEREANALGDANASAKSQGMMTASTPGKAQNLVFPATISVAQRTIRVEGKEISLSPGMAVTVEIRTGQRRVIDYVLSPLREAGAGWGHER